MFSWIRVGVSFEGSAALSVAVRVGEGGVVDSGVADDAEGACGT